MPDPKTVPACEVFDGEEEAEGCDVRVAADVRTHIAPEKFTLFLQLTVDWSEARAARLVETRAMNRLWCTHKERADEDGDGRAACYRLWSTVNEEWCDSCRTRDPHFHAMLELRRQERACFRRLCAFVGRLKLPVPADAVSPSGEKVDQ
jgi:hypothetical protein